MTVAELSSKTYIGTRYQSDCVVTVNGRRLGLRLELIHSSAVPPDAPIIFDFGDRGTPAKLLALAILADHFQSDPPAIAAHEDFARDVISKLSGNSFTLTTEQINDHLRRIINERREAAKGTGATG